MSSTTTFEDLGVPNLITTTLSKLGYEQPTPIQAQSIPILLDSHDLIAQAQTGTGKTAAFALPILSKLDLSLTKPQALVIAPTRELAIQVAEAFQSYAKQLDGFQVTPIYGGQDYSTQLRALKRGPQVIVGTPGRVIDHIERGSLTLDAVTSVTLDEGDEMLKMGFIDDISWILEQIEQSHQTVLFSATMPSSILSIAKRYMNNPKKVLIKAQNSTIDAIEQHAIFTNKNQKLDVLTRILEVENVSAAVIFVRTKTASAELSEKLQARGYAAAALNGDMSQSMREKVINRFKRGSLNIIAATDVAARGIDVQRVSHVVNYDIPYDVESYIHRIGRTGRAGRKGKAYLFVDAREKRLLSDIERATHKNIEEMLPPSIKELANKRNQLLSEKIINIINKSNKITSHQSLIEDIQARGVSAQDIAAALAYLLHESNPLPDNEIVYNEDVAPKKRRRPRPSRRQGANENRKKPSRDKRDSTNNFSNSRLDKDKKKHRPYKKKDGQKSETQQQSQARTKQSRRTPRLTEHTEDNQWAKPLKKSSFTKKNNQAKSRSRHQERDGQVTRSKPGFKNNRTSKSNKSNGARKQHKR